VTETGLLTMTTVEDYDVLRVLGTADYLRGFEAGELEVLARLSIGAHNAAYNTGLVFFGAGSALFCYLSLTSRLIPRALAAIGLFASVMVGGSMFLFVVFPEARDVISMPLTTSPIFLFELAIAVWLVKGLPKAIDDGSVVGAA
jgi:hypothetical protein